MNRKLKHVLVFSGDNLDSVAECARYAGLKTELALTIQVEKPKGIRIKPWIEHNKQRSATFNVFCSYKVVPQ